MVNNKDDNPTPSVFHCGMQVEGDWPVGHERRHGLGPQLDHQPAWQGEWQRRQQRDPQEESIFVKEGMPRGFEESQRIFV